MILNNRLKLLVIASIAFVIICTILVLSTVPLEKYHVRPTKTILHGTSLKLYEPISPVDIVRVFAKYTYIHIERNSTVYKYTYIKYCVNKDKSKSNHIVYDVSISKWTQYDSFMNSTSNSTYSVVLRNDTGNIVNITYADDELSITDKDNLSKSMQKFLNEPFREHELRDIVGFLDLVSIDSFLVSSNNYTRIYSESIVERLDGETVTGFKVYVYFPGHVKVESGRGYEHQYDKWAGIYGSHPIGIEFDIVKLPNTNEWIIIYMHVELENGVVHDYFLKDIELA